MSEQVMNSLKVRVFDAEENARMAQEQLQQFAGQIAQELGLTPEAASEMENYIQAIRDLKAQVASTGEVEAEPIEPAE